MDDLFDYEAQKPKALRIGHYVFEIRWYGATEQEREAKYGYSHAGTQLLAFADNQKPEMLADTFLHEVLHALMWFFQMQQNIEEEQVATRMATGICMVWSQNPETFTWWRGLLEGTSEIQLPKSNIE